LSRPHHGAANRPHLESDTFDGGLVWPRLPTGRRAVLQFRLPRLAPVLLATSRRSRWSARSGARTYDLDLRGAPAILERRGSPGVGPQQAVSRPPGGATSRHGGPKRDRHSQPGAAAPPRRRNGIRRYPAAVTQGHRHHQRPPGMRCRCRAQRKPISRPKGIPAGHCRSRPGTTTFPPRGVIPRSLQGNVNLTTPSARTSPRT
jgi:hypothetical protein